jgi:hypothetical protein
MTDPSKSAYSGEFGFSIVELAAADTGSYDPEVLRAAHAWEGERVNMQDIRQEGSPTRAF